MRLRRCPIALASVAAGAALMIAGCGSSGSPSSSSAGASASNGPAQGAFKFAACMRRHGVPNFPDPEVSSSDGSGSIQIRIDGRSPAVRAAMQACHGILPGVQNLSPAQLATRERELVAFASCLRAHGLKNFPDPTPQGRLTLEMIDAAGIDLHQPGVLTAAKACVGVTHGLINGAIVEHAIQEQGSTQGAQSPQSQSGNS